MARQKSDDTKTTRISWKGSYNHFLTESEKKAIKKLPMGWEDHFGRLDELVGLGYKVSFNEEREGRFRVVTVYANDPEHVNAGWSLSQFHNDTRVGLAAVWFIVTQVYDSGQWPDEKQLDMAYDW